MYRNQIEGRKKNISTRIGLFLTMFMLIIVYGCQPVKGEKEVSKTETFTEENNTSAQQSKFEEIEERLVEAESRLARLESLSEIQSELINRNGTHLIQMQHLLKRMPTLEVKKGYITNFDSQEKLQVQLVNFLVKPDAPNGFELEKTDIVPMKLDSQALIYNELGGYEVSLDEFLSRKEDYRFYEIYLMNNEIIMLTEMYIP